MTTAVKSPAKVMRTSAGLRDAIFDELDSIRSGTSNPTRSNAVAKLAGSIVETVRMEVEVQKHMLQYDAIAKSERPAEFGGLAFALGQIA